MSKNAILKGTFILTATGFITRFIGFFFRSFLSHTFGAEQVGLYQLIFPIYAFGFSLACAGIETALSRCVAKRIALGKKKEADYILYLSLSVSVTLSLLLMLLMQIYASSISVYILGDIRSEALLKLLSFALPFASVHCCFCGYYLGQKKTRLPATSQLIEQLVRVAAVYIIYQVSLAKGLRLSIHIAVIGMVIGEMVSCLYCLRYFSGSFHARFSLPLFSKYRTDYKDLFSLAIPLTSTRILTNFLQSIESISLPLCLQAYGYTRSNALSTYGILVGMVLPCILFPTALTNSVSTMLLPTVAEIQAEDNLSKLKTLIRRVIFFGFGLGSACGILFLVFGQLIGTILFGNLLAGDFIRTLAWICPFLYMNTNLLSILNGLGMATRSFINNALSLVVRITGVWIGISYWGVHGYLWGLLLSQLIVSILCISQLGLYIEKRELF